MFFFSPSATFNPHDNPVKGYCLYLTNEKMDVQEEKMSYTLDSAHLSRGVQTQPC